MSVMMHPCILPTHRCHHPGHETERDSVTNQCLGSQKLGRNQGTWQDTLQQSERLGIAQAPCILRLRQAGLTPRHLEITYEILPYMQNHVTFNYYHV